MSKEKLDQYRGKLTPEQIAAGMNAAAQNSQRLVADADALLKAGRYPSAASLAILSIEESGKVSILRGLALAKTAEQLKEAWKDYRSHRSKNFAWIMPDLVARGARTLDQVLPTVDPYSEHPRVLDGVKQLGFYTDRLGDANWSTPSEAIGKELAARLVGTAKALARAREITPKEMELWIEHLGPVWKGPMAWMKTALLEWHSAMREAGIEVKGDMEAFVRGTSTSGPKEA